MRRELHEPEHLRGQREHQRHCREPDRPPTIRSPVYDDAQQHWGENSARPASIDPQRRPYLLGHCTNQNVSDLRCHAAVLVSHTADYSGCNWDTGDLHRPARRGQRFAGATRSCEEVDSIGPLFSSFGTKLTRFTYHATDRVQTQSE